MRNPIGSKGQAEVQGLDAPVIVRTITTLESQVGPAHSC